MSEETSKKVDALKLKKLLMLATKEQKKFLQKK